MALTFGDDFGLVDTFRSGMTDPYTYASSWDFGGKSNYDPGVYTPLLADSNKKGIDWGGLATDAATIFLDNFGNDSAPTGTPQGSSDNPSPQQFVREESEPLREEIFKVGNAVVKEPRQYIISDAEQQALMAQLGAGGAGQPRFAALPEKNKFKSAAAGAASGALAGAQIAAAGGPIGMGVGALIGGLGGLFS